MTSNSTSSSFSGTSAERTANRTTEKLSQPSPPAPYTAFTVIMCTHHNLHHYQKTQLCLLVSWYRDFFFFFLTPFFISAFCSVFWYTVRWVVTKEHSSFRIIFHRTILAVLCWEFVHIAASCCFCVAFLKGRLCPWKDFMHRPLEQTMYMHNHHSS